MEREGEGHGKAGESGGGGDRRVEGDWRGDCEGAGGRRGVGGGELRVEQGRRGQGGAGDYGEGWESDCGAGRRFEAGGYYAAVRGDEEGLWEAEHSGEQCGNLSVRAAGCGDGRVVP